jgi:hypothetical protein
VLIEEPLLTYFINETTMPKTRIEYSILLSSPSDVSDERQIAEEVVKEVEKTWGTYTGATLKLLSWENDVAPQFGDEPQSSINKALGDDWDIYLGLMHVRFGSKTKRYGSGTEEEFERAHSLWSSSPHTRQLMFYFKKGQVDADSIDLDQLKKVREFKSKMTGLGGFYKEFEKPEGFRDIFRVHLTSVLTTLHKQNTEREAVKTPSPISPEPTKKEQVAAEVEVDSGLLDFIELANSGMAEMGLIMTGIGSVFTECTSEIADGQKALSIGTSSGDTKEMRNGISLMSKSMNKMAKRIAEKRSSYSTLSRKSLDAFSQAITIAKSANPSGIGDQSELLEITSQTCISINGFIESIQNIEDTMSNLPNIAREFTSARLAVKREFILLREELSTSLALIREMQNLINQN